MSESTVIWFARQSGHRPYEELTLKEKAIVDISFPLIGERYWWKVELDEDHELGGEVVGSFNPRALEVTES